jgi:uncharacterized protein (DUF488 family)
VLQTLMTIGYEATTTEAFDAALVGGAVDLVIDVRAVAASRRAGFSKTALSSRLDGLGIGYLHLRDLGDPKPGREAAREGRIEDFQAIFNDHLKTSGAITSLARLAELARERRIALVCYEADPTTCHRSIVAGAVAKATGLVVAHLRPTLGRGPTRERSRTVDHLGQGGTTP